MDERQGLLRSIAQTTSDYRLGEIDAMSPEHVDKWIRQFPGDVQLPMLQELDHVLKQTYISKKFMIESLKMLVNSDSDRDFWKSAHLLDIQQNGNSQKELNVIFYDVLKTRYNFKAQERKATQCDFVYLDDAIFSGDTLIKDLGAWIARDAPNKTRIYVVVLVTHTRGDYWAKKRLDEIIASSGKQIDLEIFPLKTIIENRKFCKEASGVLWPTVLPDDPDLNALLNLPHNYPFEPRRSLGRNFDPFSSEEGRQLLERELLLAGGKILTADPNLRDFWRPLGMSWFGLGFGSMIVTFRNCPNTCPLALWWGKLSQEMDASAASSPVSEWYPLFPRKTNSENRTAKINSWIQSLKLKSTNG